MQLIFCLTLLIALFTMVINKIINYLIFMSSLLNKFGQRVKHYRGERGLTQEELASILNIATSTLSAWENGKAQLTNSNLIKLCNALKVSEEELFSFCATTNTDNSNLNTIMNLAQQLSPIKQKQVIEIIKTFID